MSIKANDAHDWKKNDHCSQCHCPMHCAQCGAGTGLQGHLVGDADGFYFHCQEPARWQTQIAHWSTP
jgi:hypothetical protein